MTTPKKKWTSNFMGTMGKSLRRKTGGKGQQGDGDSDGAVLLKGDGNHIMSRMRVILTHLQENATAEDVLSLFSGVTPLDSRDVVNAIVESIILDDTMGLIRTLQSTTCATLMYIVRQTFLSMKEPLLPCKMVAYMLDVAAKYDPYLGEKTLEKIEEIGSTMERYSSTADTFETLHTLCVCLNAIPLTNDEQAYTFAPVMLLPNSNMLNDPNAGEEELNIRFNLLANTDEVIELMEFLIEHSNVLFDGRARRIALLKKGFDNKVQLRKVNSVDDEVDGKPSDGAPVSREIDSVGNPATESTNESFSSKEVHRSIPEGSDDESADNDEPAVTPPPFLTSLSLLDGGNDFSSKYSSFSDMKPIGDAVVLHDYTPVEEGELRLVKGMVVQLYDVEDEGWWCGGIEETGQRGVFPALYVKRNGEVEDSNEENAEWLQEKLNKYQSTIKTVRELLEEKFGLDESVDDCEAVIALLKHIA